MDGGRDRIEELPDPIDESSLAMTSLSSGWSLELVGVVDNFGWRTFLRSVAMIYDGDGSPDR